jgi:hypothetical protein
MKKLVLGLLFISLSLSLIVGCSEEKEGRANSDAVDTENRVTLNGISMAFPEEWMDKLTIEDESIGYENAVVEGNELSIFTLFGWVVSNKEGAIEKFERVRERLPESVERDRTAGENLSLEGGNGSGEVNGIEYQYLDFRITSFSPEGNVQEVKDQLFVLIPEFGSTMTLSNTLIQDVVAESSLASVESEHSLVKQQVFQMLQTLERE